MYCYITVLVCLAVAVSPILSLNCCIPELVDKIQASSVKSVLRQEKSFGLYQACILSDTDADRFTYVYGRFNRNSDTLNVTVNRQVEPKGIVTRQYSFVESKDNSYEQVDLATGESISVYSIYSSPHYTAKYGCVNSDDDTQCADGSDFVQCAFPPGTKAKYFSECQQKLDAVVKDYIKTENICKS